MSSLLKRLRTLNLQQIEEREPYIKKYIYINHLKADQGDVTPGLLLRKVSRYHMNVNGLLTTAHDEKYTVCWVSNIEISR